MMTLGGDLAPRKSVSEFLGVWRLMGDAGAMGSPLVVGAAADVVGLIPAVYCMTAIGLIATSIFAFAIPETLRKRR